MRTIKIFDTTLRDGEQSPGCSMNLQEKLEVAARLEALRADVIEAGFAVSSPDDFEAVKTIAQTVKNCSVASLTRAIARDIDRTWEALKHAKDPCIHLFLATSPVHMEYKLKMPPEKVLERAVETVRHASGLCPNIEFSAEDATRSDWDFLAKVFSGVIAAGATTINVPDTVGYTTPHEMAELIAYLKERVEGIERVGLSVHCHNDLGMAVANTLAAVKAGATQAECTINGIGERAGNAALEEIALALHTKKEYFGAVTNIDTRQIYRSSRALSSIIGMPLAATKPIVGANAFAHEAGIHQHGVLANRSTYEIMRPEDIGIPSNKIVLGKHSGRHAFEDRLNSLGFSLSKEDVESAFAQFKMLADRKKVVSDDDIIALISDKSLEIENGYQCVRFVVNSGSTIPAMAAVKLKKDDVEKEDSSTGDGPIDAVFNAIDRIVDRHYTLLDYSIRSVTEGEDALGEAIVKLGRGNEIVTGRGLSTDIIEASVKAYLSGVNKLAMKSAATEV
ncbi:MAG: 2-isopropylmalate synthase [Oscillospiraceae bacterium]|nr:2-isopropylmalate synthase [Oscillospiraceae bacterium]